VLDIYPSDANFILVKTTNAKAIYDFLVQHGIIIRDRSKVELCEGCLRITIGTSAENKTLAINPTAIQIIMSKLQKILFIDRDGTLINETPLMSR
jgi:histidinol-phosphate/aromatic aminotransferase/cobyric acid decarboxylase-like protein